MGCTIAIAAATIEQWLHAGILYLLNDPIGAGPGAARRRITLGSEPDILAANVAWGARIERPLTSEVRGHPIALLSLFDGTGFARLAVEDALQACPGAVLTNAAFVEIDHQLRNSVNRLWQRRTDRKSTRLNSSHSQQSRMPSSA